MQINQKQNIRFIKIWTLSEVYHPEETSTGYFMTKITESLSSNFTTSVICARPNYDGKGAKVRKKEIHNGVRIFRVYSTIFNKNNIFLRVINMISFCMSSLIFGIQHIKKNDLIFVVTNPPFLPIVAMLVAKIKGAEFILKIDDVYPDILEISSKFKKESRFFSLYRFFNKIVYKRAKSIIVLGRDMKKLLIKKEKSIQKKICIITSW